MHFASFYGPDTLKEKRVCEPYLDTMIPDSYLIMGDYNGTTYASHTTTLRANVWPWLAAKEKAGSLVDLLLPHTDTIPYTRVRRFAGTKSYIDSAYGTQPYHNSFEVTSARVIDFSSVDCASDHDTVTVSTIPWTTPHLWETRCAQWNRRDVQLYRALVCLALQDVEAPESSQDVDSCYSRISGCMLAAMRQVNASCWLTTHPTPEVSDWYQLVKQLARQAKQRSKTFFDVSNIQSPHPRPHPPSPYPHRKSRGSSKETLPGAGRLLNTSRCHQQSPMCPDRPSLNSVPSHALRAKSPQVQRGYHHTSCPSSRTPASPSCTDGSLSAMRRVTIPMPG